MNEILSEGMIIGGLVVSIAYKFITGTYDFVSKKLRK